VMLFTGTAGLRRMATMNHSALPAALIDRVEAAADDPGEIHHIAVDTATELSQKLLDGGAPGLHLYTLNRSTAVADLWPALGR
jgi:methylenetetrahydrofolate reductase (NADPH)